MVACCAPMVLIALLLAALGVISIGSALTVTVVMVGMVVLMGGMGHGMGHGRQR